MSGINVKFRAVIEPTASGRWRVQITAEGESVGSLHAIYGLDSQYPWEIRSERRAHRIANKMLMDFRRRDENLSRKRKVIQ